MPFVIVKLLEGKNKQEKHALANQLTYMVAQNLRVNKDRVFVCIEELSLDNYRKNEEHYFDLMKEF
jgi:4-oxalocrotonate tautomerase family enzyme